MKKWFALALFLALVPSLFATVPVTGTLLDGKGAATSKAYVTATLVNCGSNTPKVIGTGIIASTTVRFTPSALGVVSDVILGNDSIDCGSTHNSLWQLQYFFNGLPVGPPVTYAITSAFNLNSPPAPATPAVKPATPIQGVRFRGAWSGATAYQGNDVVFYAGSSYAALLDSTNVTPGTDGTKWTVVAQKGDPGQVASLNGSTATAQSFANGANISVTTNTGTGVHTIAATGLVTTADSRLTDARTPVAHNQLMSTITDAGNSATKNVGTTAGTVAAGDDSRIVNAATAASVTAEASRATTAEAGKEPANANIQTHIGRTDNPHSVTKTQVGLGSVLNVAQEPALGNPDTNGYVLSSTSTGTRSWVAQSAGGGVDTTAVHKTGDETAISGVKGIQNLASTFIFADSFPGATEAIKYAAAVAYRGVGHQPIIIPESWSSTGAALPIGRTWSLQGGGFSIWDPSADMWLQLSQDDEIGWKCNPLSNVNPCSAGVGITGKFYAQSGIIVGLQGSTDTGASPMLIDSGTTLKVRLADNSADADFTAKQITATGGISTGAGATTIAVTPTCIVGGCSGGTATLASLVATAVANKTLAEVADGATSADCTTGSGTNVHWCLWTGSAWTSTAPVVLAIGTTGTTAAAGNHTHSGVYEPVITTLAKSKGGAGADMTNVTFPSTGTLAVTIASGTATLGTSAIGSAACASVVTVAATGVATTDVVSTSFSGDPTAAAGFIPSTSGMLTIFVYPTTNNVNVKVCNLTTGSITPAATVLNWRVSR